MTEQPVPNACPSCGKWLAANAVVCIHCGFDKRKGRRLQTLVRRSLCLPRVSGVQSFLVLLLCMGLTALLVPMALKLSTWIKAEIVIAVWWAIWGFALTLFLYNGWLVTHDFQQPTFSSPTSREAAGDSYSRGWWDGFLWGSFPDFSIGDADNPLLGCLALLVLIIVLPFLLVFLVEAAVLLAFVMYLMIRGMLAQVANSRLRCRGRLGRAVAFGVLWATLYTLPLAGLVWLVHRLHS
jgi:hypothetical protein